MIVIDTFSSMQEFRAYKKYLKNKKIAERKKKIRTQRNYQCRNQEIILDEKIAEHEAAMLGKGCSWKFDTSVFSTVKNVHDFMHHEQKAIDVSECQGLVKPRKGKYFEYDMTD